MSTTETVAQATLTSASAFVVSFLGVEASVIFWSFIGSVVGLSLAKPTSRVYAAALFVAATFICGLLGTIAGEAASPGSLLAKNGFATAFGLFFHPGVSATVSIVPDLVKEAWARVMRVFGSSNGGQ